MTPKANFNEAMKETEKLISDVFFMMENRAKASYFTREPKMGFKELIMFSFNLVKKTLQTELNSFFRMLDGDESDSLRKQSYTEARGKILPEAFSKIFYHNVKWFYENDSFERYKGYRVSAIDGFKLEIPDTELLREEFGFQKNKTSKVARAMGSGLYDVANDKLIAATITRYDESERKIAMELIRKMIEMGLKNDLILFDRGYPSTELISFMESSGIKYLMRSSTSFLKVVVNTTTVDEDVHIIDKDGKIIKVRVVKLMLDSGIEEILITNLSRDEFSIEALKVLYFSRWSIEVKYNELKNRMQLENFTGTSVSMIKQDFYASMYLSNMISLAKKEANDIISERNKSKDIKFKQKVNTNILIGELKGPLVRMMLENDEEKRTNIFRIIMKEISRNIIPIRPDRSMPREKRFSSNKYTMNQKSCL